MSKVIDNAAVVSTQHWVNTFIVDHNICPFARKELDKGRVHFSTCSTQDVAEALHALMVLCQTLDQDASIETALLVFSEGFGGFDDYLDLLDIANQLLVRQGYEGVYQLASFHPDYCFDGVPEDDASHYTNRSPYPMLHIIREAGLEKALERYPNPERIPERNIAYCQSLGGEALATILGNCSAVDKKTEDKC